MANIPPPLPPPPPASVGESVSTMIRKKGQFLAWVPHEENVFTSTIVNEVKDDNGIVIEYTCTAAGKQLSFPAGEVYLINNEEGMNMSVDDLVHLDQVNDPSILHCVGLRFSNDQIYTNLGTIVISVNPFKWIDGLYGPELIEKYSRIRRQGVDMPPHIYTIADAALCAIVEEATDQSIIISGESGAGKTEAVKKCLQYISIVAGNDVDDKIEERILSSNPVLEAFGNAKTLRNNNSSRFGKFMQIHFDPSARILGCSNTSYLLEKSRVVYQDKDERNFHIFYLLCKGAPDEMLMELKMKRDPNNYKYINRSGCIDVDGIDDKSWYKEVLECFGLLGFDYAGETMTILKLVSSILLLGNISFVKNPNDSEQSLIKEEYSTQLEDIASLLGVDAARMKKCLIERQFQSGGRSSMVQVPMKDDEATSNRDSLCKEMYSRLFKWLIFRINESMNISGITKSKIGVLDIFGFEIFEKNSFEQMCINFANEKLQQHFTSYTFKMENALYKSEGIDFKGVSYIDNQNVLDLLEKKRTGLFSMLNEELRVPRGSSIGFFNKAVKRHAENKLFKSATKDSCFTVSHYAGCVTYSADMLLEKNRDTLFEDLLALLSVSKISLISQIYSNKMNDNISDNVNNINGGSPRSSRRSRGKQSIATMFGEQLTSLMKTLYSTTPHYIRCIKPNTQKKPGIFTPKLCMEQLKYSGIFEAVTIRKSGYPFRYSHELFWKRFKCLVSGINAKSKENDYAALSALLINALISDIPEVEQCILGKTLVLYRAKQNKILESSRGIVRLNAAITCQYAIKIGVAKLQVKRWTKAYHMLRQACAGKPGNIHELKSAVTFCQNAVKGSDALNRTKLGDQMSKAIKLIQRLEEITRINKVLNELFAKPPLEVFEPLKEVLYDAATVDYESKSTILGKELFERVSSALKIREKIAIAAIEFDYESIIDARPKLIKLQSIYGGNFGKEELTKATKAQNEIESEWIEQIPKLQRAIKKGAVTVPDKNTKAEEWTKRALAKVSVAHLQYAEEEGKSANIKSKRGKELLLGIKVLQVVRALLLGGEWEAGLKNLNKLQNVKDTTVKEEVNAIRSAYAVHSQIPLLLDALRHGRASGPPPSKLQTIELETLEKTLALFEVCDFTAPDILSLVDSSKIVLAVRKLWKEKQLSEIEIILNENNVEKLHSSVNTELKLAEQNCKYSKLMISATNSIEIECIKGEIGKLRLSNLKLDTLQATINGIRDLNSNDVASKKMLQTLDFLLVLRKLVKGGELESLLKHVSKHDVSELLISSYDEIELCKRHVKDELFQNRLKACLSSGNVSGEPGTILTAEINTEDLERCLADAETLDLVNVKTRQLVLCGSEIINFRKKVLKEDWDTLFDLVKTLSTNFKCFDRSQEEAEKIQHEVMERLAMDKLKVALDAGKVKKKDEHNIDYMSISTESIDIAFAFIQKWNCSGKKVCKYQESVKALQNIRINLKAKNWIKLKIDISSILSHVKTLIQGEIDLAKSEIDNVEFIENANIALKAGGPVGGIGSVAVELIDTGKLEKCIKFASSISRLRSDAQKLLATCQLVLKNRLSLANTEYANIVDVSPEDIVVFNDIAHKELKRMRREKENYILTEALKAAMETGKVTGTPGNLKKDHISCKAINGAILLSKKYGIFSEEASGLMEDCEKILKLRTQCKDDKWDELSISIINTQNHMFYSRQSRKNEFDLISKHLYNHSLINKAMKALVIGGPVGLIGSLDTESVDLALLDDVIQYEFKHGCHSLEGQSTMRVVHGLKIMRDLVRRNVWTDVLDKQIKSLLEVISADEHISVPKEVSDEVIRVKDELNHIRVVEKLRSGLKYGKIAGAVGKMNKSAIKYDNLKEAIEFAEKNGCKSKLAQNLKCHAKSIFEIRQSLLACLWSVADKTSIPELWKSLEDGIKKAKDPAYDEVKKARDELNNYYNITEMKDALRKNNVNGTMENFDVSCVDSKPLDSTVHNVNERGVLTVQCNFLYGLCKQFSSLRTAVLNNRWEQLKDVSFIIKKKIQGAEGVLALIVPRSCLDEVQLCFVYSVDRLLIASMQKVLQENAISGQLNDLKVTETGLKNMQEVISKAEETKCQTSEAIDLLKRCNSLFELRKSVDKVDWEQISKNLNLRPLKLLSDGELGYDELMTVRNAEEEHNVLLKLESAIETGAPTKLENKETTFLDCTTVNTEQLEMAIVFASEVGCKTIESKTLKHLATYILKIRQSLECAQIEEAGSVCNHAIANNIYNEEITLVSIEYKNKHAVGEITKSLKLGKVDGVIGDLRISQIQFHSLQLCVNDANQIHPKTKMLQDLIGTAKRICELRELVYKESWEEIAEIFSSLDDGFTGMSLCCHEELSRIRTEMLNNIASKTLQTNLSSGAIKGVVGDLNLTDVDVSALIVQVKNIENLREISWKTKEIMDTAKLVINLRQLVTKDMWEACAIFLDKTDIFGLDQKEVMAEFDLVLYHLKFRNAVSLMELALVTDCVFVDGKNGVEISPDANVKKISHALTLAKGLAEVPEINISNVKFKSLLATVELLCSMRSAGLSSKWEAVKAYVDKCIDLVEQKLFYKTAADEVNRAEDFYFAWKISTTLSTAISTGSIQLDSNGNLFREGVEYLQIETALNSLQDMKTNNSKSNDILNGAMALYQVRKAVKNYDLDSLGIVMQELKEINEPSIAGEINTAKKILNDYYIHLKLNKALNDIDHVEDEQEFQIMLRKVKTEYGGGTSKLTTKFVALCDYIVTLKEKLLSERWEDLADILSNPPEHDLTGVLHKVFDSEIERITGLTINQKIQTDIKAALEHGDIRGDVNKLDVSSLDYNNLEKCIANAVKSLTYLDQKSQHLLESARYVRLVRETTALNSMDFEELIDVISKEKVDNVDVDAKDELALVYHYVQNLIARKALRTQIKQGRVTGTYEELYTDSVDVTGLRQEIEKMSYGFHMAEATSTLLNLATYVELVRKNISNLNKLEMLLKHMPEKIDLCAIEELTLVKQFYYNCKLKANLENIFADTLPSIDEMTDAIAFSKKCEVLDDNNRVLLNSAKCLLSLKQAGNSQDKNWVSRITAVLHDSEGYGKDLCQSVITELKKTRIELEDKQASHILRTAIANGGPAGNSVGQLDLSVVSVQQLDAAIDDVSQFAERSDQTDVLLRSARILRLSRMALLKNNFRAVENFDKVCSEAKEEFSLIVNELWNNQIQKHLNEVLSRGKVIGFVGNLRVEVVQTEPLAIVLADADSEDHVKSKKTIQLIDCARLVLSLRRGISGKVVNSHEMFSLIDNYDGEIFESASTEVQLIRDEVTLRMSLSKLEAALEHQSLKELLQALETAEALPTVNSRGRQLLRFAKLMKSLLVAEESENWDSIREVLSAVTGTEEPMPTNIVMKFHSARVRLDNRNAEMLLTDAISTGCVTGTVEKINYESISTDKLDHSLLVTKNVEELDQVVENLARIALAIRECRRCVVNKKISLLENNSLMIGKVETLEISKEEVHLIRDCVDDKRVINLLSSALMSDETSGTLALDNAIEHAQHIGCKSSKAKELLKSAYVVVRIRQLRQNGDWEALLEYTKNLNMEYSTLSKQEVKKAISDCLHYARTILVAREAMHAKDWPTVRSALTLYDSFPPLGDGRIEEEINAIRGEVNDRTVCEAFRHALSQGGAHGHAGRVVTTSIRLSLLDKSISLANDLGCNSSEAQSFYRTAYVIQQLRTAAKAGEWLAVEAMLQHSLPGGIREIEAGSSMFDSIVHDELRLLLDHIVDMKMVKLLNEANMTGRIITDVESGEVDLQAVDPKPLARALNFVDEHSCRSEHAENLARNIRRLHQLRSALVSRDWVGVFKVVKESANEEMTRLEMTSALNAVANMRSEESLRKAIKEDSIDGVVGHVLNDKVKLEKLDDAIKSAREAGIASKRVEILLNTAQIVRRLRYAVLENDWEEVEQTIGTAALLAATGKFAGDAEAEMNLCLEEVEDKKLQHMLNKAMTSSGSRMLKEAIAVSRTTILVHSELTQELLHKAIFLADIREAHERGDMVRVQGLSSSVPIESLKDTERKEVTMLLNTASDNLIMKSLWEAIESAGQALYINGKLDTTTISRSRLLLAISDAKQENIMSDYVLLTLAIAESLAALRGHISAQVWVDVLKEVKKLESLCEKIEHLKAPKSLQIEILNAKTESFKHVTMEKYSGALHHIIKVQSIVRRFFHKKVAKKRLQSVIVVQKYIRTYNAKKVRAKLIVNRNEAFLAARAKEKEMMKNRNIEKWDLAANSIVKDIQKGIRLANSPDVAKDEAVTILSRALKVGRAIKLHQHHDARVVAQIVRCEQILREILYQSIEASK